jgi:uncharacterized protein YmfQ (DUF2313 family)
MSHSAAAYQSQLTALLPSGLAWPRDAGSVLGRVLAPIAAGMAAIDARAADLLLESDPRSTAELLSSWEADTGQPDPCTGAAVGLEARRRRVVAKLTGRPGGLSRAWYIALAAAYGFAVTITEFAPTSCEGACELPAYDEGWRFTWRVNGTWHPVITEFDAACDCDTPLRWWPAVITDFDATSGCETPLRSWGDPVLECTIRRTAPAHTTVLFSYQG